MGFDSFDNIAQALKCPARRVVYLSERKTVRTIQFVDRKFILDLGSESQAPGVLINGELFLIHTITHIDCRAGRRRKPCSYIHFVRSTLSFVCGHYYFFNPPGCQQRLLKIPADDITESFFPANELRDEVVASMPWDNPSNYGFPFDRYELPIATSVEV
jgi:hypothetical protein